MRRPFSLLSLSRTRMASATPSQCQPPLTTACSRTCPSCKPTITGSRYVMAQQVIPNKAATWTSKGWVGCLSVGAAHEHQLLKPMPHACFSLWMLLHTPCPLQLEHDDPNWPVNLKTGEGIEYELPAPSSGLGPTVASKAIVHYLNATTGCVGSAVGHQRILQLFTCQRLLVAPVLHEPCGFLCLTRSSQAETVCPIPFSSEPVAECRHQLLLCLQAWPLHRALHPAGYQQGQAVHRATGAPVWQGCAWKGASWLVTQCCSCPLDPAWVHRMRIRML